MELLRLVRRPVVIRLDYSPTVGDRIWGTLGVRIQYQPCEAAVQERGIRVGEEHRVSVPDSQPQRSASDVSPARGHAVPVGNPPPGHAEIIARSETTSRLLLRGYR